MKKSSNFWAWVLLILQVIFLIVFFNSVISTGNMAIFIIICVYQFVIGFLWAFELDWIDSFDDQPDQWFYIVRFNVISLLYIILYKPIIWMFKKITNLIDNFNNVIDKPTYNTGYQQPVKRTNTPIAQDTKKSKSILNILKK